MLDQDSHVPPQAVSADPSPGEISLACVSSDQEIAETGPPPLPSLVAVPPSSPGVADALRLCALFYLGMILVGVIFFALRLRLDWFSRFLLQLIMVWPLVLWAGLLWHRVSFRNGFPLTRFPVRIIPALLVASYGATIVLIHAASYIAGAGIMRQTLTQGIQPSYWLPCFLAAVIVAPVAEELFFRGLVLRGFVARYSAFHAVWMSALLFALFHLNLWQGILALPLGFVYAWLVLRTGSVLPGIISHAAVNFSTNFLMVPLMQAFGLDAAARQALGGYPLPMLVLGGMLAVGGGGIVWRQLAEKGPASQESPP